MRSKREKRNYLGGAIATHARVGDPLFSVIFPVILGAMLWAVLTSVTSGGGNLFRCKLDSR